MTEHDPWKPCDLRGVFPSAVGEGLFRRVGLTVGSEMPAHTPVVVGGDFRLSTPQLKRALTEGLMQVGLQVVDVGQAPTPVVYFAASILKAGAVFIVTASHNPPAHNGLKWMIGGRPPSPGDMQRIRSAVGQSGPERRPGQGSTGPDLYDPTRSYIDWITARWRHMRPASEGRIVIDPGNGAWSRIAPRVFRELGFETVPLHSEPDGSFPNRAPDCARTENLAALRAAVRANEASLGIAWDGDGDRVAFVDQHGSHASTDEISILLARSMLARSAAGERVICDIKLSDSLRREVIQLGGIPKVERSGHAFMRTALLENDAILGLDACGHYFFRETGARDDGLYSALFLLDMLSRGQTLGDLRRSLAPIFSTPELRLPADILAFSAVRDRLRGTFRQAEESAVDGLRLTLDDGVVLARESSTEPVVSLRIEGFSSEGYSRLLDTSLRSLAEAEALLRRQIELSRLEP